MSQRESCIESILRVYPNLDIQSAAFRVGGQYNDILIVNDSLLFRFPRFAEAFATLADETAILQAIHSKPPLLTPNPIYTHFDTEDFRNSFVGYQLIAGEAVNIYGLEARYDGSTCQRLADQLADFLKALHTLSTDQLPLKVVTHDAHAYWFDLYRRIREKLFPLMSFAGREQVTNHFEPYLADDQHFDYKPVLHHGDFGTGNILFDEATQRFTGVIDFGSVGLGDAAVDLSAVYGWRGRGETFARRMFRRYPELEAMLPRAQFYAGTFLLQEALFGAENNQPDLIESGLEPYI
ncbi:MAG: phosphotransferase [Anaerolineaceae bacterium]|nr:phosphotransferase [Anaerolineaceae bacterium]